MNETIKYLGSFEFSSTSGVKSAVESQDNPARRGQPRPFTPSKLSCPRLSSTYEIQCLEEHLSPLQVGCLRYPETKGLIGPMEQNHLAP